MEVEFIEGFFFSLNCQLPLIHKDLFSSGLRKRSGVLLYGPPGTGKVSSWLRYFYCFSTMIYITDGYLHLMSNVLQASIH